MCGDDIQHVGGRHIPTAAPNWRAIGKSTTRRRWVWVGCTERPERDMALRAIGTASSAAAKPFPTRSIALQSLPCGMMRMEYESEFGSMRCSAAAKERGYCDRCVLEACVWRPLRREDIAADPPRQQALDGRKSSPTNASPKPAMASVGGDLDAPMSDIYLQGCAANVAPFGIGTCTHYPDSGFRISERTERRADGARRR